MNEPKSLKFEFAVKNLVGARETVLWIKGCCARMSTWAQRPRTRVKARHTQATSAGGGRRQAEWELTSQHGQRQTLFPKWINRNKDFWNQPLASIRAGTPTHTLTHAYTPPTLKTVGRAKEQVEGEPCPLLTSISCLSHSSNSVFLRVWWATRSDPPMMCGSLPAPGNKTWKTRSSEVRHIKMPT